MTYAVLSHISERSPLPGFHGKFFRSSRMTFVSWRLSAGAALPEHSHFHEQVTITFKGNLEMTIDGVTKLLEPASICVIPPNALHSGRALTDCEILDVFSPVREDYIKFEE